MLVTKNTELQIKEATDAKAGAFKRHQEASVAGAARAGEVTWEELQLLS
jgi:hypothetical protein